MNEPITQLISDYLYGHITDEQFEQLQTWLREHPEHIKHYVYEAYLFRSTRSLLEYREMAQSCTTPALLEEEIQIDVVDEQPSSSEQIEEIKRMADQRLTAFLEEEHRRLAAPTATPVFKIDWAAAGQRIGETFNRVLRVTQMTFKLAVVSMIALLFCLAGLQYMRSRRVLASITSTTDAVWMTAAPEVELRAGVLALKSGLVELTFKSGDELILEGPATLRLLSTQKVMLESGIVSVQVPVGTQGFTVETPVTEIVDLGTQFGVRVDKQGETESHVFSGKIEVAAGENQQRFIEGQAVQVDTEQAVHVYDLRDRPQHFVNHLPRIRFDLASAVAGGNGLGGDCPGYALDPGMGQIHPHIVAVSNPRRKGDHQYHTMTELPYVDGVFVPDGNQMPVLVSSAGHTFAQCPPTSNEYWSDIGNTITTTHISQVPLPLSLNGTDYCTDEYPGINLHANAGVTFDLHTIRQALPYKEIVEFQTVCGVSDGEQMVNDPALDLWILVDGQIRFSARNLTIGDAHAVQLDLRPQDRFLSLVSTDGGNGISPDHALFGEPTLILQAQHNNK